MLLHKYSDYLRGFHIAAMHNVNYMKKSSYFWTPETTTLWFKECVAFVSEWDGGFDRVQKVYPIPDVNRRGRAQCGDAAAAILAASAGLFHTTVCMEEARSGSLHFAHIWCEIDGQKFDPYAQEWSATVGAAMDTERSCQVARAVFTPNLVASALLLA